MNIVRLLFLEVKRKSLRPYYITILVSTFCSFGFLYLMACIPKIDPYDSDIEMFNSYHFVIGLTMIVMMGIYIIISAIIAAKVLVDEYTGKKVILLFSYPICRKQIISVKIFIIIMSTFLGMMFSGVCIFTLFILTECIYPICIDSITVELIIKIIINLVNCALISGCCGVISGWIGFKYKSIIGTIISSCIIMIAVCQISAIILLSKTTTFLLLMVLGIVMLLVSVSLRNQVEKIEL